MEFTDEIQISGWGSWCVVMGEDGSVGYSSTGVRALCRLEKKVAPVYEGLTQTPEKSLGREYIYMSFVQVGGKKMRFKISSWGDVSKC